MTVTDRRLLGVALGLALLVAACGGSTASPSVSTGLPTTAPSLAPASASPSGVAPSESSGSSAPAESASAGASSSSGAAISLTPGQAADLEAMLPSSVGSTQFTKSSFDGSQIPASGTPFDQSKLDPVLQKYGKSLADVRFAQAVPAGGTALDAVYAIQLKGVPASQFMSDVSGTDVTTSSTVGGKTVFGAAPSGQPFASYVYPKDDILFVVVASVADASAIVSALP